mgnify:CR=1 FL=1
MSTEWIAVRSTPTVKEARPVYEREEIDTREGAVVAEPGDYVIREEDGNCYPIGPDKFREYYELWTPETDDSGRLDWFQGYCFRMVLIFAVLYFLARWFK